MPPIPTPTRLQKCLAIIKSFFSGLFWPLTWLTSKSASVGLVVSVLILIMLATATSVGTYRVLFESDSSGDYSDSSSGSGDQSSANCNVVGIEIRGCIMTYRPDNNDALTSSADSPCNAITSSEEVIWKLDDALTNEDIKAVVLEIDSGGGSPVAAEEISAALKALGKPTVAWVRESADSAAYWVASAANTVIASAGSDVGSIGVTSSYVDNAKQNSENGLTYNQLTTGKYKDTGSPERALTADDRSLILRDLDILYRNFINAVAVNRHLSVETVTALADGSTTLGQMALENGLIDKLGTKKDVWDKLAVDIGEKPEVCWP